MTRFLKTCLVKIFAVYVIVFPPFPAHAAQSGWAVADQVRARLLSGGADEAALEIEIAEGWHSYWRVPGDAGLPPQFNWNNSENLGGIEVEWPAPQRFDEMGLTTFGYKGRVIFPLRVKPAAGLPPKLGLNLNIMVCKDICIPQTLDVKLDMADQSASQAAVISAARRHVPKENGALKIETVVAGPEALVITASGPRAFSGTDIFAVADDMAFTAIPEILPEKDNDRRVMITLPKPADVENLPEFLAGKELSVTVVNTPDAAVKNITF